MNTAAGCQRTLHTMTGALNTFRTWLWAALALLSALPAASLAQPDADSIVRVSLVPDRSAARPGDQLALAILFEFEEGWHIHTNDPQIPPSWEGFVAKPTSITIDPTANIITGTIQWPKPMELKLDLGATGTPEPYAVFGGRSVAYLPIQIASTAVQAETTISVTYQACDDTTCMPAATVKLPLRLPLLAAGEPVPASASPDLFTDFNRAAFATLGQAPARDTRFRANVFGFQLAFDAGTAGGMVLLLLVAILGGFLLNLTPCVLPVIPLKVMALSHSAGNPARAKLLGLVMSFGVVAFWLAIGWAISAVSSFKAVNQLFQLPWFTIGVGAFILFMAVGMLGLFQFKLPGFVYMLDPKTESIPGSFLFGIMTAVLSTPCTAPFMGAAVAWATKQPQIATLSTFAAIGLGMALPYLVLAFFPNLLSWVPRSGPISELVKQSMGLLMVGVAIFFLGTGIDPLIREPVDDPMRWHWYLIAFVVTLAAAWTVGRTLKYSRSTPAIATTFVLALAATVAVAAFAHRQNDRGPIRWIGFTPERFEKARTEGKVIVLDFTAEWCLNCKALETSVLHLKDVAASLNAEHVIAMKVDLTGDNPAGQAKLKELNWVGIPLLAVFGPGNAQPVKYDSYTGAMVREAVAQAQGNLRSQAAPVRTQGGGD